jgi:hypothetical protein
MLKGRFIAEDEEGVYQDFAAERGSPVSGLILRRLRRGPRCLEPALWRASSGCRDAAKSNPRWADKPQRARKPWYTPQLIGEINLRAKMVQKLARGPFLHSRIHQKLARGCSQRLEITQKPACGPFLRSRFHQKLACGRSLCQQIARELARGRFPRLGMPRERARGRFSSARGRYGLGRCRGLLLGRCDIVKESFDVFGLAGKSIEQSLFQSIKRLRARFHGKFDGAQEFRFLSLRPHVDC